MSLSITCKNARDVRQLSDVAVAAARAKFFSECGVSLDDVGGIVIDEVSFITAAVFGHVDHVLRAMTGPIAPGTFPMQTRRVCGGQTPLPARSARVEARESSIHYENVFARSRPKNVHQPWPLALKYVCRRTSEPRGSQTCV